MNRLIVLVAFALLAACEGLSCAGEAGGEPASGDEGSAETARPVTEDGYEVILANPNKAGGPRARSDEEIRRERERAQLILEPTTQDPHAGRFSLEEAVEGMPLDGELVAEITTDLGTIFCDLHADRMPRTVAAFVGIARGRRAFWDPRAGAWVRRPLYVRTRVHRVVPELGIQLGDFVGDGVSNLGFSLPVEEHPTLRHDRAGQLCMASAGPTIGSAQLFITDGAAPDLDGGYTIIGQCRPTETVERVARVPQSGAPDHAPLTPVEVDRILVRRVAGGAEQARISPPTPPEGFDPTRPERGASPGPSEPRRPRLDDGHGH